jgi:hypothetical protein
MRHINANNRQILDMTKCLSEIMVIDLKHLSKSFFFKDSILIHTTCRIGLVMNILFLGHFFDCWQHKGNRWCSYHLTATWRVSLVKQELLTLAEHMSSSPVVGGVRVVRSLVFCVVFCRLLFVLVRFAMILYVFRFTL